MTRRRLIPARLLTLEERAAQLPGARAASIAQALDAAASFRRAADAFPRRHWQRRLHLDRARQILASVTAERADAHPRIYATRSHTLTQDARQ